MRAQLMITYALCKTWMPRAYAHAIDAHVTSLRITPTIKQLLEQWWGKSCDAGITGL